MKIGSYIARKLLCLTGKLLRATPPLSTTVTHDVKTVTNLMCVTVNNPLFTLREHLKRLQVVKHSGAQHSNCFTKAWSIVVDMTSYLFLVKVGKYQFVSQIVWVLVPTGFDPVDVTAQMKNLIM